jgi:hypothetical protein
MHLLSLSAPLPTHHPPQSESTQSVASHALDLKTPLATSPISSLAVSVSLLPSGSSFAVTSERPQSASQVVVLLPPLKTSNLTPGRIEFRALLLVYLLTLPLQLVTTGSFLEQGTTTLVVFTAIHAGAVAVLFWMLLGNALVATQVVEDGTPSSLIPFYVFTAFFMAATTYISLDVAFTITSTFEPGDPKDSLHSVALFILTLMWPGAAALLYLILMVWIVAGRLHERRPLVYYALAGILFILSQLAYFLLSRPICDGTNAKIDGSFIATALDTATIVMLYLGWQGITEEYWVDNEYYPQ